MYIAIWCPNVIFFAFCLYNFTKAIFYLWDSCWSFVSMLEKVFYTHIPRHNSPQNGDHFDFVATQYHSHPIFPRQEAFYNVVQDYWKQIRIGYSCSTDNFGVENTNSLVNVNFQKIRSSFNRYFACCMNWFYLIWLTRNLVNTIFSQNQ